MGTTERFGVSVVRQEHNGGGDGCEDASAPSVHIEAPFIQPYHHYHQAEVVPINTAEAIDERVKKKWSNGFGVNEQCLSL